MKILLISPFPTGGGVGYFYNHIKSHFTCDVHYFYTGRCKKNSFPIIGLIMDYFSFVRKIVGSGYDLIHINPSLRANAVIRDGIFLLIAKLFRKKTIVFFRGWDDQFESIIKRRYSKLFGWVYFYADSIIVLASRFKSALQEMGYTKPIFLETTLVPDEVFDLSKTEHFKNGVNGKMNILFLSRIEKYKGVYEAIEAFIFLKKKYSFITLSLAGDGAELDAVKYYLESRSVADVTITGWLDGEKKMEAFKNADIYLFPSYAEGLPNSLLEAMAFGLPVITRPVGGIKDFFQDGVMGFLTESTEPLALAQVCELLIKDNEKRAVIGQFNRKYASEHFLASKVCKRLEAVYTAVVHNNSNIK